MNSPEHISKLADETSTNPFPGDAKIAELAQAAIRFVQAKHGAKPGTTNDEYLID